MSNLVGTQQQRNFLQSSKSQPKTLGLASSTVPLPPSVVVGASAASSFPRPKPRPSVLTRHIVHPPVACWLLLEHSLYHRFPVLVVRACLCSILPLSLTRVSSQSHFWHLASRGSSVSSLAAEATRGVVSCFVAFSGVVVDSPSTRRKQHCSMIFHSHLFKKPFSSAIHTHTHSNLLKLCNLSNTLFQTKQVHAVALIHGFLPYSISLCASLILQYATFGNLPASLLLFQRTSLHSHSAFLWNTLIRANSISRVFDGFHTYNRMICAGVRPDDHTFPFVLKCCSDFERVEKGKEVHGFVFKLGFDNDVFVGNTLLMFYGNCGFFADAKKVFDEMPERDKVSWNTVIGLCSMNGFYNKALWFFREMVAESSGFKPDLVTVISVLPICAETEDEVMARLVHCYALKVGLVGCHVKIGNALVDAYGKCGNEKASKRVFYEMDKRNIISWNAVMTSFSYRGLYKDAFNVFRLMIDAGMLPNSVTVSSMLPVLTALGLFKLGREVHGLSLKVGMEDIFIANSLIDMYAKSGYSGVASAVFNKMIDRNIVSWNAMVANLAQNRLEFAAIELVRRMQANGEIPNTVTFTNVLSACGRLGFLHVGKEIHAKIIRMRWFSDLFVSNALTDMYSKCGHLHLARNIFNIAIKDEVSYNMLIMGYSQTSDCLESLNLFSEMILSGMVPDIVSFMGAISACANLASMKQGKEIHGLLVRQHFYRHLFVANSLLDLYTKCGRIDLASKVFDCIEYKDTTSWNTMILGYGMLGELDTAINL
ncbi:hypothetical protein Ahy_B02g058198 [Arachis hypogaea]|uniref:Pentatricopeptide repeat-containing protein n=1 Tax=Arachis hypogaea TaxID=3818 RepID=A0A445AE40_ARAHY|nr:hypothetical protein Ahy_B02g058198 [Arachis hypogaea]